MEKENLTCKFHYENEKQWRKLLLHKVERLEDRTNEQMNRIEKKIDRQNTRIAGFGSFFGLIGMFIGQYLMKVFTKH